MLPWLPRDVVGLIRDAVARTGDKETLFTARMVSKSWRLAVATHADPLATWCPRLRRGPVFEWSTTFAWPVMDVEGVFPFNPPPFVLEILLLNKNPAFRETLTWSELAELAVNGPSQRPAGVDQQESKRGSGCVLT
jgi:hypothetical protein